MYIVSLVLFAIWYILLPLFFAWKNRNIQPASHPEKEKIKGYRHLIAQSWGAVLAVIILCLFAGIRFTDIGLRGISFSQNIWFTVATLILCGLCFIVLIYQLIAYLLSSKYREKYREEQKEERGKDTANQVVNNLLPRSKRERKYWFFVSLTAGIGEEFVFRGFLFFLLQTIFPNMPMLLVLLSTSVIFGIGHTYQAVQGIVRTAIAGAIFGSLFLVTSSLIPAMFLHVIFDISDVFALAEDIV